MQGINQLTNHEQYHQWIELGPQPILIGMCKRLIETPVTYLPSCRANNPNQFEQSLAQAYSTVHTTNPAQTLA